MRPCLVLALLCGCNRYDLFRVAGYQQESFSNRADVLFVIDNSDSMLEESESLAVNFASFIEDIDELQQTLSYEGLPDAVTNYVDYVQNRSAYIDYAFSITTTDVDVTGGKLIGKPVVRGEDDIAQRFVKNLACEATCFPATTALPDAEDDWKCGDPVGAYLSEEFMDCECGDSSWLGGNCGAATEEGLEAVFLAMCRAVPNPPVECFEDITDVDTDADGDLEPEGDDFVPARLDQGDALTNEGMLRENANFIPVIVSDEGDGSRHQSREEIPEKYVELFAKFRQRMSWVYIGPGLDEDNEVRCPGTATDWGVVRYNYMVYTTSGLSIDIYEEGDCDDTKDFGEALDELGALLNNLLTSFPLQSVPVPETLLVLVDGDEVPEASVTGQDQFGLDLYSDGWSYDSAHNSISFHGTAIPSYDANVEVYYLPVDGMPRDLPF